MRLNDKIFKQVFLWFCISIISVIFLEVLFAIFSPSPEVKRDLLGRKLNPFKNGQAPEYETFYHGKQPYHDFRPSQKGEIRFYNEFFFDWQINELGLRDSRTVDPAKDETCRVLFLGDSQTFGYVPQDKTFCRLIEDILDEKSARKIITFNGGVPGYGQYESLWKLIRIYDKVKPDIIIPVVYIDNWLINSGGNDLWSNYKRGERIKTDKTPEIWWGKRTDTVSLKKVFIDHFHVARPLALLRNKIIGKEAYTLDKIRRYIHSRNTDENLSEAWATTICVLKEIERVGATRSKAATVILYLPSIESLLLNDNSSYQEFMRSGLPVVDMFEILSPAGKDYDYSNLRYKTDAHYNQYAHKIIAEKAADFLLRNKYIESEL